MADLFVLGLIGHLFADWGLQNDWQATHKVSLRHPAAWVHFGCHLLCMLLAWGITWGTIFVPITHALIDTRKPLVWWRTLIGQKQVDMSLFAKACERDTEDGMRVVGLVDPGHLGSAFGWNVAAMSVAFWQDQAAHIIVIGLVSILRFATGT